MYLRMHLSRSAFFSLSSLREVLRKPKIMNTVKFYCCFYLRWNIKVNEGLLACFDTVLLPQY